MFAKGQTIIQIFEQLAPKHLAVPDDKIGLQVGTLNKESKKIMLTLDVLENVIDEAIDQGVDLIISHHAIIFRPLKNLRTDMYQGRVLEKLIKHDIAVYSAHTNLDAAEGGVNDALAKKLELQKIEILDPYYEKKLKKIVVFVPETHQQQVIDALTNNGAGWIGNYSHCTFSTSGTGTFMPREGTSPYIGEQGKLEKVNEIRIETIVPEERQNQAIRAMLQAHPYEEVAYDIYPLDLQGKQYGIGRLGQLKEVKSLGHLAQWIKEKFHLDGLRVVGDQSNMVKKVAVVGGDGHSYINKAVFKGADVLVTGDIDYHVAHDAMALGLALIDVGHHIEKEVLKEVKLFLEKEFLNRKISTEVLTSEANTNPFQYM